jgi:hypothetical protein
MKKLQREPIEIDLCVSNKQMTEKERKELGEFIDDFLILHCKCLAKLYL